MVLGSNPSGPTKIVDGTGGRRADTESFAWEMGFSWRAVGYENSAALTSLREAIDGRLPQLIVTDRSGKVLANGLQSTAPVALNQLDALLKQPAD